MSRAQTKVRSELQIISARIDVNQLIVYKRLSEKSDIDFDRRVVDDFGRHRQFARSILVDGSLF